MDDDYEKETLAHINAVNYNLIDFVSKLNDRRRRHDSSKLTEPEYSFYRKFIPQIKQHKFNSEEYNKLIADNSEKLQLHYRNNSHHPEHYEGGIAEMNLLDLLEMLADWKAVSGNKPINLAVLSERFLIPNIIMLQIKNTLDDMEWSYE